MKKNIKEVVNNILDLIPVEEVMYQYIIQFRNKMLLFPEKQIDNKILWNNLISIVYEKISEVKYDKNNKPDWIKKVIKLLGFENSEQSCDDVKMLFDIYDKNKQNIQNELTKICLDQIKENEKNQKMLYDYKVQKQTIKRQQWIIDKLFEALQDKQYYKKTKYFEIEYIIWLRNEGYL